MAYCVTAPLVVARQSNGTHVYLYAGAPLPDTVSKDEAERLVDGGFVESLDERKAESKPAAKRG